MDQLVRADAVPDPPVRALHLANHADAFVVAGVPDDVVVLRGRRSADVRPADDPCRFTPYREAQAFARKSGSPLVTVRGGGPGRGPDCEALSAHGFAGVEVPALMAMQDWIRTGRAPAEVAP